MQVLNTDFASIPDLTGRSTAVMAVVTSDSAGFFACYVGIVSNDYDPKDPDAYQELKKSNGELVMRRGNKITHREALRYFPQLPGDKYRD